MSWVLLAFALVSSPYPFEIQTGFAFEPTAGYLFNDKVDDSKAVGGVQLSYLLSTPADAIITSEIQFTSATAFDSERDATGDKSYTMKSDYLFETGFVFYEIYNPVAFRFATGGGVELRKTASLNLYYRAGLGTYLTKALGFYADLGGRMIFRAESVSQPLQLGVSAQVLF